MNGYFVQVVHTYHCERLLAMGIDPGFRQPYHAIQSVQGQMRVEKGWQRINPYLNAPVIMMAQHFIILGIYDSNDMVQMGSLQRVIIPALRERAR